MGRIVFLVYRAAMFLLLPVILIRYFLKAQFTSSYRDRIAERFGFLPAHMPTGMIWIHAVSVGEVNAAVPLINDLLQSQERQVLVTCVTPTGSTQISKSLGEQVAHVYAPFDAGIVVRRFLNRLKPAMIVIMETELWPNLIHQSASENIPVVFANMRLSDRTFAGASRIKQLSRFILKNASAFCVQTEEDGHRIVELGAQQSKVSVTGNLKFDVIAPEGVSEKGKEIREYMGGDGIKPVILGSSHDGEEAGFLDMLEKLKNEYPNVLGIVVPRHPERFDSVFEIISRRGFGVVRKSQWGSQLPDCVDVVLVDSMGELMEFYAASDIAVVGGSFVPVGGHNILEPLMVGTPLVFGPQMSNFRQISRLVLSAQAGHCVADMGNLGTVVAQLLKQSDLRKAMIHNGYRLLTENRGSVESTREKLLSVL